MALNTTKWLFILMALALGAAASSCAPVMVTETVYVTATCTLGQCSAYGTPSLSISSTINAPAAPPPPSSVVYSLPAPPANGVTFTSAGQPQHTGNFALLCSHVQVQAQAEGFAIPPMPFGTDRDANIATYDALPTLAAALCQAPDNFHRLTTTPNHGSIKNSCNYEVYVDSVGCGNGAQHALITPGSTWSEPIRDCSNGGLVYKVTKADNPSKPLQFEINHDTRNDVVYYDISFLDCMRPNTTDLSACPGWEEGVQCVPGGQNCQVYVCGAGEYCDGSSYTVPEFGLIADGANKNADWRKAAGAPVTNCKTKAEGIAFELCAAN